MLIGRVLVGDVGIIFLVKEILSVKIYYCWYKLSIMWYKVL